MKSLSEITNETIKEQINEYHIMVTEILSGMDAGMTSLKNENLSLRDELSKIRMKLQEKETETGQLRENVRILRKEVLALMAKQDALKDYTEHGFAQLFRRYSD